MAAQSPLVWDRFPLPALQRISECLPVAPRQELRALNRRALTYGGRLRVLELQRSDRALLSCSGAGPFHSSLSSSRAGIVERELDDEATRPRVCGMKGTIARQSRSLVRCLLQELRTSRVLRSCQAASELAAELEQVEVGLRESTLSLPCFVRSVCDAFSIATFKLLELPAEKGAVLELQNQADSALLHMETPELLYAALDWPAAPLGQQGRDASALVLTVSARVELSEPMRKQRWLWLEVGIIDNDGIDCVPRVPCLPQLSQQPSRVVRLHRHLHPQACPMVARLVDGVTNLLLASSGSHSHWLAVWVRAQDNFLFQASVEVQMASFKMVCSVPSSICDTSGSGDDRRC